MSRVKIEDLDPQARELDMKEMKNLFGGLSLVQVSPDGTLIHHDADKILFDGAQIKLMGADYGKLEGADFHKDAVEFKFTK